MARRLTRRVSTLQRSGKSRLTQKVADVRQGWRVFDLRVCCYNFCVRCGDGCRSDCTFINLIAPPDDAESLTPPQIVKMFWSASPLPAAAPSCRPMHGTPQITCCPLGVWQERLCD